MGTHWENYDNDFSPAIAPWDWEVLDADYTVKVKEDFTAGQILEFGVNASTVQFQPMALEWSNNLSQIQTVSMPQDVSPIIANPEITTMGYTKQEGTVTWLDAYGANIDFEWRSTPATLKKTLTIAELSDLPAPEQYIIDGGNPFLRLNLIFDPSGDLGIYVDGELWDKSTTTQTFDSVDFTVDGQTVWFFTPLLYWDSANSERQSIATLRKAGNSLYIEIRVPYDWLQAATFPVYVDADVQIDGLADTGSEFINERGGPYWKSTLIGYVVYVDNGSDLVYSKTTDGGANWGSDVEIHAGTVHALDCWADWETEGDTGEKIHIAYICSAVDDVMYAYLDTSTDSTDTDMVEWAKGAGIIYVNDHKGANQIAITKSRGGMIAIASMYNDTIYNDYEDFHTSTDGDTWSDRDEGWYESDEYDRFTLYPGNEADPDDLWMCFWDDDGTDLDLKTFDDSEGAWSTQNIDSSVDIGTTYVMWGGAIRHSDGHLIFCSWNALDTGSQDLICWDIDGASSITETTDDILTASSGAFLAALMINQDTDDIYVAYAKGTTIGDEVVVYYKKSTDGGDNWGTQQAMQVDDLPEGDDEKWISGGAVNPSWGGKWMPIWFNDDAGDLMCNVDNAVTIAAAAGEGNPYSWGTIIG